MKTPLDIRPEIAAFASGAFVMIFEILGARILGSYVGTSIYVWTSIISLILGALALGYYHGGKLSDKGVTTKTLAVLFTISGFLFLSLPYIKDIVLMGITDAVHDIRFSSLIATGILFVPVSFVLGMIQPIATKLHIHSLEGTGKVIGRIGSIGTLGSIIGTLAAGFFLVPFFGIVHLLVALALSSLTISLIIERKKYFLLNILGVIICIFSFGATYIFASSLSDNGVYTYETPYSHITVQDEQMNSRDTRVIYIDNITHAGKYLNSNELLYKYTKFYHLFDVLNPNAENILMLGGAAYSYPQSFLQTYTNKNLDVVEIDPGMTKIAQKHFGLVEDPRLNIIHQDARVFLNTSEKKYDAILGDAFGSYFSIPFQLTTLETVQKKYDMLTDNGVVILNIIGNMSGEKAAFLEAEYLTYKQIFPEVFAIPVESRLDSVTQNIMIIAAKNPETLNLDTSHPEYKQYISQRRYLEIPENTSILVDNHAPVDYYVSKLLK